MRTIDQVRNNGEGQTRVFDIIVAIEKFYKNSKRSIVSNAAQGWSHAASIDKQFIEKNIQSSDKVKISEAKEKVIPHSLATEAPSRNAKAVIEWLNNETEIVEKYRKLKTIIEYGDVNLINDSFIGCTGVNLSSAQEKTFSSNGINIVIIGAGITGLFLASTLKNILGKSVNILILENRSDKKNTRKPFNREWLTHIEAHIFQKNTSPMINELFKCFGIDGFVGLPLNMLEAILMLSCKDQGVKFYFSPNLEYLKLNNKNISFFFDATGGHLTGSEYSKTSPDSIDIKLPKRVLGTNFTNLNQVSNGSGDQQNYMDILLKKSGLYHCPYIGNDRIKTHMVKITAIPINLLRTVANFIEQLNDSSLFYIWKGVLQEGINSSLIFINLTQKEYNYLFSLIDRPIFLKTFLHNNQEIASSLNNNIKSFMDMLIALDESDPITINPPFIYEPYINLNAECGYYNDKRIFPIGDSYFCGHPKVGNGLWTHLGFVNHLVEEIKTIFEN